MLLDSVTALVPLQSARYRVRRVVLVGVPCEKSYIIISCSHLKINLYDFAFEVQ